jgi:hypothetical protein
MPSPLSKASQHTLKMIKVAEMLNWLHIYCLHSMNTLKFQVVEGVYSLSKCSHESTPYERGKLKCQ